MPGIRNKRNKNDESTTFSHFTKKQAGSKTSKSFSLRMRREIGSIWTLCASTASDLIVRIIIYCLRFCKKCLSFVIRHTERNSFIAFGRCLNGLFSRRIVANATNQYQIIIARNRYYGQFFTVYYRH